MNPTEKLLHTFYTAFQNRDHAAMSDCYDKNAVFVDEVFILEGEQIGHMWHMLCEKGTDLSIQYEVISVNEQYGEVFWIADYTFSATKRKVHNRISATFKFRDGLITEHRDSFDFWKWSRQSLGIAGYLLGWTGFLKNKVRTEAAASLQEFSTDL